MNANKLHDFFKNKRIALVGPSKCVVGAGMGAEIETFDLVARMNHQWPVPLERQTDVGKRMDLLYHCCNPDFSMMRLSIPEFQNTKLVFYEQGIQTSILKMLCTDNKIPSCDITWKYRELEALLNTFPNTGIVAISHLLSLPIASLKLFGLTFFKEPYYEGYLGAGTNSQYWADGALPRKIWKHQLDVQYEYFLKYLAPNPCLSIDEYSRHILLPPQWHSRKPN